MSFDEDEIRRALEARSGELTPDYRARVRQSMAAEAEATPRSWMAALAVLVVTALTATSVGLLVASRHPRVSGPLVSGPRVTSPSPGPTPSPVAQGANVQLSVPSPNVAFALVEYGSLFRTTDHGDHWVKRSLPTNFGVRPSITFINESEGWLLAPGSPATQCEVQLADIWHTNDGGRTWQDLGARIDKGQCKNGIWFVDSMHGFVTAWDQNHRPTVFRTSDGGDHWTFSTVPDNPIFVTGTGGFTLHVDWMKTFGSTVYLEASGTQHDPTWPQDFIYTSNDGGATWVWKQKVASPVLVLVTQTRWLELDAPGQLSESVNGGQAMGPYASDIASDTPVVGTVMLFADAGVGYIAGGGKLQRTTNGGAHWTQLSPPWAPPVAASPRPSPTPSPIILPSPAQLSAPTSNVLWALVGGARIFVSTDRGETWQERSMPAGNVGTNGEIAFIDATHGWMSTCPPTVPEPLAKVWRTTDGALSWQQVTVRGLATAACLKAISFADAEHGFTSYWNTTGATVIYRSSDGGDTWAASPIPDPPGFKTGGGNSLEVEAIRTFGAIDLAAVTNSLGSLYIYRSVDNGATWTYLTSIPNSVASVGFVTSTRWVQVIAPGQSQETTDSGKTWHSYASDYSQAAPIAPQVVFGDASVGYATVRGEIQRTVDGGLHWTQIQTPGVQQTG